MFQSILGSVTILVLLIWVTLMVISDIRCNHSYEVIDKLPLVNENDEQVGVCYVLRCTNCGKIKYSKFKHT